MTFPLVIRGLVAVVAGGLAAGIFDAALVRRGLLPTAFRDSPWRRRAGALVLAAILTLAVFLPVATLGAVPEGSAFDPGEASVPELFLLHGLLVVALLAWLILAFPGAGPGTFARQLGLTGREVFAEVVLGLAVGLAAWMAVIATTLALALAVSSAGGEELLPQAPPPVLPWIAGLPVGVRLGLCLSAGVVEEVFFRGLLQPRVGLLFATVCFALAHLSYQQPFLLVGVTLLSLIYGGLVLWRRNLWAAITAHTLFDAIQLLVVIPAALEVLPEPGVQLLAPGLW